MSDKSGIEWTDATWNPVTGCSQVSEGCRYCYAERLSQRMGWTTLPWNHPNVAENVALHPERLDRPLHWKTPRRVFVNSMSDLFHERVPDGYLYEILAVMAKAQHHIFQVLTKRPERMRGLFADGFEFLDASTATVHAWPFANVWLGVSVEDQRATDERIPLLLGTPAAVRFLSCEPLLGPLHFRGPGCDACYGHGVNPALGHPCQFCWTIAWVIVGGESGGPASRRLVETMRVDPSQAIDGQRTWWEPKPDRLDWVRSIRDQCAGAGVPFFFKQWGGPTPRSGGRLLDGRTWDEYPAPPSDGSAE